MERIAPAGSLAGGKESSRMNRLRSQVCQGAADQLAQALPGLSANRAVVGLDGFVDAIIAVVDKRFGAGDYEPVRTITAMAEKIRGASGESSNYELVVKQRKLGGNGPIMANALACLGLGVTYLGSVGYPEVDPVFADFAQRADVKGIAPPGNTDALEFDDGKLLLGKYESLAELTWDNLVARTGRAELERLFECANLIAMNNWTMLPRMSEIWDHLIDEILPLSGGGPGSAGGRHRKLFIDLADPEKRTFEDIRNALGQLTRFQACVDVTLGLNLKEAIEISQVLGLRSQTDSDAAIEPMAIAVREALGVGCVVIHPRRLAAVATAAGAASFPGPFVQRPLISTGAGDHFNAGFCLGQIAGLGLEESLCAGVACSGYYVRTAQSPSSAQLADFIRVLPDPEP
jgi:sugar/nucleoside kinase (ribokinase family)